MSGGELLRSNLEDVIRASDPLAAWHVSETPCGLIAAFTREADAEKLLQRGDLARIFEGPVQVDTIDAIDVNMFLVSDTLLYVNNLELQLHLNDVDRWLMQKYS